MISAEPQLRLIIVLALLVLLMVCQSMWPRRRDQDDPRRRLRNLCMAALGSVLVYLVLPISATSFALLMQPRDWGLLHAVHWAAMLEIAIAVTLLDLAIYWQHRASHRVPCLWRIHRVHHSDTLFEVTLGLRFHPLEILLSMLYKFAVILIIGASPVAVTIYEILLACFALLTHSNLALPERLDHHIRRLLVTPDFHRVHHSIHRDETDSNYGNLLTLWDRLFGSRIAQPRDGHTAMQIGLEQFREPGNQTLQALLRMPLDKA